MKYFRNKILFTFFFFIVFFAATGIAYAKTATTTEDFRGKIVMQTAHYNDVWYVHPKTLNRYYIPHQWELDSLMRTKGVGIFTKDLEKIAKYGSGDLSDPQALKRFSGYIVLQ